MGPKGGGHVASSCAKATHALFVLAVTSFLLLEVRLVAWFKKNVVELGLSKVENWGKLISYGLF